MIALPPRAHAASGGGRAAKFKASPWSPPAAVPRRGSNRGGGQGLRSNVHGPPGAGETGLLFISQIRKQNSTGTLGERREASTRTAVKKFQGSMRGREKSARTAAERQGDSAEVGIGLDWLTDGVFFCTSHPSTELKSHRCRQNFPKVT